LTRLFLFQPTGAMHQSPMGARGRTPVREALHCLQLNQFAKAERILRQQLELPHLQGSPRQQLQLLTTLAIVCAQSSRFEESIELMQRALAVWPGDALIYYNLGKIYARAGNISAAIDSFRTSIASQPESKLAHNELGLALMHSGELEAAVACFRRALFLNSTDAKATWNLSLALLILGCFEEGWELHEIRWQVFPSWKRFDTTRPQWHGEAGCSSLLLWAEQGIGDQLMFTSLLPDLYASGVQQVVLLCDPRLHSLFQRSFQHLKVLPQDATPDEGSYQAHIPVGSLGRHLRPAREAFPPHREAFLRADPARASAYRCQLVSPRGFLCGISWHSFNAQHGAGKSMPLDTMAKALSIEGVTLVSLQYGDVEADIRHLQQSSGITLNCLGDLDCTQDLDGLAALIQACDLVVSISNTTVHLAGALGKESWALLEHVPDWRWGLSAQQSLWYSSLTLFRQQSPGDWSHPLSQVNVRLRQRLSHMPVHQDGSSQRGARLGRTSIHIP
jgi:tetratricopeptide (TPR) repeat protein